jgi:hypothetical protein
MTAVHRVFRNAFAAAPRFIGSVADGDSERAQLVGGFFGDVIEFLRVHHESEDELLFPRLLQRAADPETVARIGAQHHDIETALGAAAERVTAFRNSGSAQAGAELVTAIAALDAAATPHLDEEERTVLPAVEQVITAEEWGELPGHALGAFRGEDMFLIIGLVREQFSDAQNAAMLEAMPPPAAEAWRTVGLDAYKAKVAALVAGA